MSATGAKTGWKMVEQAIERAETQGAVVGACIVSPDGERFAYNADRRFVAASTVKIPIMVELFRQVDAGRQSLAATHVLSEADKTTGSGVVAHLHDGLAFTLGDLAYLMMSISDNTATNILIERVGMANVNATIRDLGMHNSTLGRIMRGRAVLAEEHENWAAPSDYATAIGAILADSAASPASCARMLGLLEKQQNDRRIARHLPRTDRPRWGSKTGSLPGVVNDVGFVITPRGPLVVAVFCERLADALAGEQIVGDIARAALDRVA